MHIRASTLLVWLFLVKHLRRLQFLHGSKWSFLQNPSTSQPQVFYPSLLSSPEGFSDKLCFYFLLWIALTTTINLNLQNASDSFQKVLHANTGVQVTQGAFHTNVGLSWARDIADRVLLHPTQPLILQMAPSSTPRKPCERGRLLFEGNTAAQRSSITAKLSDPSSKGSTEPFLSVSKQFIKGMALEQVTSPRKIWGPT